MKCTRCGGELNSGDLFCQNCGLKVPAPPAYNNYPSGYMPQKSNTGMIVAIVTAAVAVVLAVVCVVLAVAGRVAKDKEADIPADAPVQQAQQTVPPVPGYNREPGDGYFFESDKYYITEEILGMLSRDEVRLVLNEMYARHGYIFKDSSYRAYFMNKSWYAPRYESQADAQMYFNTYEEANRVTIINYETRRGWR